MSPEQQQIAIAEACGWQYTKTVEFTDHVCVYGRKPVGTHPQLFGAEVEWDIPLPDYLNDLNAMHEAERSAGLFNEDFKGRKLKRTWSIHIRSSDPRFATAAQRAEALLKTLKLWTE